jgi:hypothetical protein
VAGIGSRVGTRASRWALAILVSLADRLKYSASEYEIFDLYPGCPASQMKNRFRARAQGNLPAALDSYKASLTIADRLAKADPGNAGWQSDLSVSHDRIGGVLRAQGNLPAALDSCQASLAIRDRKPIPEMPAGSAPLRLA